MKTQLQKLRELLAPETRWTKGAAARDQDGNILQTGNHPTSVCYCLLGGIERVSPDNIEDRVDMRNHIRFAIQNRYQDRRQGTHTAGSFIADFNDAPDTTHEMVLDLIDWTIEHA